jgi:hypothetical protein
MSAERDETKAEWCARRRWKYAKFQEMEKRGLAPETLRPPGTNTTTITPAADAAWEARMRELAQSDEAKLEAQRRSDQRRAAVQVAIARGTHDPGGRKARDLLPKLEWPQPSGHKQPVQRWKPGGVRERA